jgi:hypothetical protein
VTSQKPFDKGEGFGKDKVVLSGVGDTASRQSLVEDQDLQASRSYPISFWTVIRDLSVSGLSPTNAVLGRCQNQDAIHRLNDFAQRNKWCTKVLGSI